MRGVNLIPARHLQSRRRRRHARRWLIGAMTYAVILGVGCAAMRMMSGGAQRAVADHLVAADTRIGEAEHAIKNLQPRLIAAMATLEASRSVGDQPNWSILMGVAAGLLGDEAVLTRFALQPMSDQSRGPRVARQSVLHLRGLARSHEEVSAYVLALERLELFDQVKLRSSRREPIADRSAVAFEIDAALGGARLDE